MRSSSIRRLAAVVVLVVAVGHGHNVLAAGGGLDVLDYSKQNYSLAITGELVAALLNGSLAAVQLAYIVRGERSNAVAATSIIFGALGAAAGGVALGVSEDSTLHGFGVAAIASSGINIVLAVIQLVKSPRRDRGDDDEEDEDLALTPVTFVDASGQLTAGAGLTGRF